MDHTGPTLYQSDKWNCQVFINSKNYKIVFKIRKDYVRIILFRVAMLDLCFKQVHNYVIFELF